MLLAHERRVLSGNLSDVKSYFCSLGFTPPSGVNPIEFYLEVMNSDNLPEASHVQLGFTQGSAPDSREEEVQTGLPRPSIWDALKLRGVQVLLRRFVLLATRGWIPVQFTGNVLVGSCIAFVFWAAREHTQAQVLAKVSLCLTYVLYPLLIGLVRVYDGFQDIQIVRRELQSRVLSPLAYVMASFIFRVWVSFLTPFTILVPMAISGFDFSNGGQLFALLAGWAYVYESLADFLATLKRDNIVQAFAFFLLFLIHTFLYSGIFIQIGHIIMPFRAVTYVMPSVNVLRSLVYLEFANAVHEPCDDAVGVGKICFGDSDGSKVLDTIAELYPDLTTEDTLHEDILRLLRYGCMLRFFHALIIFRLTRTPEGKDNRVYLKTFSIGPGDK